MDIPSTIQSTLLAHPSLRVALAAGLLLAACQGRREAPEAPPFSPPRKVDARDVAVPEGYRVEAVATGLDLPTGAAVDDSGRVFVTLAGYSYGDYRGTPRLVRLGREGAGEAWTTVAEGDTNGPWNGVVFHDGAFYVAEGGHFLGGRILRIDPGGEQTILVDSLPSLGDHHTNGPAIGPDGRLYFGQGTATNSAVVGLDNLKFGWLTRYPDFHDVPCRDVVLEGRNYVTPNPLTTEGGDSAVTGAYVPFGTRTDSGQVIPGRLPCGGAVFRLPLQGGAPELVAWGFRNPFGVAFSPDGRLFAADNGYDVRGSRPAWGTADLLWEVAEGAWYGWPDFSGGRRLDQTRFRVPDGPIPDRILAAHPSQPPAPKAFFGVHSSSNGLEFSRSDRFGHAGEAFVAQFGDMSPNVGKVAEPVGYRVVRVDVERGVIRTFATNRQGNGPAHRFGGGGLERPVSVRFSPDGEALYVVDFGVLITEGEGTRPYPGTGVIWKITREAAP